MLLKPSAAKVAAGQIMAEGAGKDAAALPAALAGIYERVGALLNGTI